MKAAEKRPNFTMEWSGFDNRFLIGLESSLIEASVTVGGSDLFDAMFPVIEPDDYDPEKTDMGVGDIRRLDLFWKCRWDGDEYRIELATEDWEIYVARLPLAQFLADAIEFNFSDIWEPADDIRPMAALRDTLAAALDEVDRRLVEWKAER